jgi:hypothetical protein
MRAAAFAMLVACHGETHVRAPPPRAIAPVAPHDLLGWFESVQCVRAMSPTPARVAVRMSEQRVDVVFADAYLETGVVELEPSKQDAWTNVSAIYAIGKAAWMVDGWVVVDAPYVAPSTRRRYARDEELRTLSRRVTLAEDADGLVLTLASADRTGDHARFPTLRCFVAPPSDARVVQLETEVALLSGPRTCEVASACCRAIRAKGQGTNDEDSNDVCNATPLMPAYCRTWLDEAIDRYRFPTSECTPLPDGSSICAMLARPSKGRPALAACVAPEIGLDQGATL